jgi:hypothetical protein
MAFKLCIRILHLEGSRDRGRLDLKGHISMCALLMSLYWEKETT